jgi:hypothetical protein
MFFWGNFLEMKDVPAVFHLTLMMHMMRDINTANEQIEHISMDMDRLGIPIGSALSLDVRILIALSPIGPYPTRGTIANDIPSNLSWRVGIQARTIPQDQVNIVSVKRLWNGIGGRRMGNSHDVCSPETGKVASVVRVVTHSCDTQKCMSAILADLQPKSYQKVPSLTQPLRRIMHIFTSDKGQYVNFDHFS